MNSQSLQMGSAVSDAVQAVHAIQVVQLKDSIARHCCAFRDSAPRTLRRESGGKDVSAATVQMNKICAWTGGG